VGRAAVLAGQLFVGWSNDYLTGSRPRRRAHDKPLANDALGRAHGRASRTLVALAAAVPLSLASGVPATIVHWWPSRRPRLKPPAQGDLPQPLPYAVSFALLPAFITSASRIPTGHPPGGVAPG